MAQVWRGQDGGRISGGDGVSVVFDMSRFGSRERGLSDSEGGAVVVRVCFL